VFAEYLDDMRSQVKVFAPDGRLVRSIGFPAAGAVNGFSGDWNNPRLYFAFQSFHMPPAIFRHVAATGAQDVFWKAEVPFDSDAYEVRQEWYASKDGTRVPLFLVHRKGLARNVPHPTVLTGYGGFTVSQTPSWSPRAAAWVDAGGVYAVAGLRGGGEFGEDWHRAGMRDKKQNTFDDFIAAAEWLMAQGYTSRDRLAITGGSNGGLLTGAAVTQRPELFAAVVSRYPLLDMVRYHKFLVARFWVPEYGSAESPDEFRVLRAYSPYHNVKRGARYPALLFMTGDGDTRVDPLHGRKMAALMQAAQGADEPVLLRYDVKAGHSAGVPVALQIEELADELAFMAWQTGLAARAREEKAAGDVTVRERYPALATVVPGHGAGGGAPPLARTGELPAAARAARRPERTAPSITAGSPVSVQSPAR
jgi:prolyl oligopeptidase